ncbi:hypothetical protein C8R44DRAFT_770582 [Mycena epipterygia]|nr:hypothetical protein C8R44DRAFT_809302 [Mycena epipterygia]KAJ7134487.1 hypothetical protein C8R44DRAFT_770582 [Mycena epipterygia]
MHIVWPGSKSKGHLLSGRRRPAMPARKLAKVPATYGSGRGRGRQGAKPSLSETT